MKKLLFSLVLLVLVNCAFAHTVTTQCWNNGRFGLVVGGVHKNMSVKITVNHWDTTINIKDNSFSFTVPQAQLKVPVKVKFKFSDGYSTEIWTNSASCGKELPLKFRDFKVRYLGYRTLFYTFILSEVTNVKQINLMISEDGKVYKSIGVILPDNMQTDKQYSIKLKF